MAEEVAAGLPGATVIASEDDALARQLQDALNSARLPRLRQRRPDRRRALRGREERDRARRRRRATASALGDNAKAALITRGLAEMARLGEAAGADPETFSGLAGMGDLIVTCWHPTGRNRRAGELIARGAAPEEAAAEIGQVVEGLTTAPVLRDLSHRLGVELPITEGVCAVLDGSPLTELAAALMGRKPTDE